MAKKEKEVAFDEEEVDLKDSEGEGEEEEELGEDGLPDHEKEDTTLATDDFADEEEDEEEGEEEKETKEEEADLGVRFSGIDLLSARLTKGQVSEEFTESVSMQPVQYITQEELGNIFRITEDKNQDPQLTIEVSKFNTLLNKVALAGAKTAIRSTPKVIASAQKETAEIRNKVEEFFKKNKDLAEYSTTVTRTLAQNQSAYPEKSVDELLELTNVETRSFLNLKPEAEGDRTKKKKSPRQRNRSQIIRKTGSSQDRSRMAKAGKMTSQQKEMEKALGKD